MKDSLVQKAIIDEFEEKRAKGERWENEFGCLHKYSFKKEYYCDSSQYKIDLHEQNNIIYFKIVPIYYQIPYGHRYWYYYDGFILENRVQWNRIRTQNNI